MTNHRHIVFWVVALTPLFSFKYYNLHLIIFDPGNFVYVKPNARPVVKVIYTAENFQFYPVYESSINQNGNMVSYVNIPLINDAMREAAFENGCAFWNLYEAMGGKNSMVEWQKNGLARKDFTHFTSDGAKYVGEMLFESLLELLQD